MEGYGHDQERVYEWSKANGQKTGFIDRYSDAEMIRKKKVRTDRHTRAPYGHILSNIHVSFGTKYLDFDFEFYRVTTSGMVPMVGM